MYMHIEKFPTVFVFLSVNCYVLVTRRQQTMHRSFGLHVVVINTPAISMDELHLFDVSLHFPPSYMYMYVDMQKQPD